MSFSLELKQEILNNKPMRMRHKEAQAYGLFLFGRAFGPEEVSLHTESQETAALFEWFARSFLGREAPVRQREGRRGGRTLYRVSLEGKDHRLQLLELFGPAEGISRERLPAAEDLGAFFAGAFLACGSMSDPEKSLHLEFVPRDAPLAEELAELLEGAIPGARTGERRKRRIVYYKEYGPVEDLMALMGAPQSCLSVIDIETYKSVRNLANRATNCETANIDKLVGASAGQIEDIRLLLETLGEEGLPEPLLQVARLRLENPEASLRELAACSPEPISRSGVHHRLDKLSRMAAEIREQNQGGKKNG